MSSNRAWMPLHIDTYLADTGHLTGAEHGAYMLLIMTYWRDGGLPDDERLIARIAKMSKDEWAESRDILASFFKDGWRHSRIDAELAKADEIIEKRRNAALGRHAKSKEDANAVHVQSTSTDTGVPPSTLNQGLKEEPNGSSKKPARLPVDFAFPAEWRQWAINAGLPAIRCELEFTKLTNWAANAPGAKGAKRDWFKAWQNWVLKAIDELPKARGSPAYPKPERPDHFANHTRELIDGQDRSRRSDSRDWDDAQSVPILAIDYERR